MRRDNEKKGGEGDMWGEKREGRRRSEGRKGGEGKRTVGEKSGGGVELG